MLETYWSSELSQLQEMQKREYREWVTKVHEDMVRVSSGNVYSAAFFYLFWNHSAENVKKDPVIDQLMCLCMDSSGWLFAWQRSVGSLLTVDWLQVSYPDGEEYIIVWSSLVDLVFQSVLFLFS